MLPPSLLLLGGLYSDGAVFLLPGVSSDVVLLLGGLYSDGAVFLLPGVSSDVFLLLGCLYSGTDKPRTPN